MTEQSDGGTDARIQAAKVIAGPMPFLSREPSEGGWESGEVCRTAGGRELAAVCKATTDQSGAVFDATGWAGDRAEGMDVQDHAGLMTERTTGLVPMRSSGFKPTS